MKDIEVTGVQDGPLAYEECDGSGCGFIEEATFGDDHVRPAPDGGLFIKAADDSGCGRVFPGDVVECLCSVQARAINELPPECCDGTAEFRELMSAAPEVNPDALDEDCSSLL